MKVDVIIPTWNNPEFLFPCVDSVLRSAPALTYQPRVTVINNGHVDSVKGLPKDAKVLTAGKNLGWEGGLKLGLKHSSSDYVLFLNDDTYIPESSTHWLDQMVGILESDPQVAAVGPASNVVMGLQNIFLQAPEPVFRATYLIGFCMLVRRAALENAGGIDDSLPGGDDLDVSMRLRHIGGALIVNKGVFVYHHGFKTGTRVHGEDWNSIRQQEATARALIGKHGLRKYHLTVAQQYAGAWRAEHAFV